MRPRSDSHRPVTPDLLRAFLKAHLPEERLRRMAGADRGRDAVAIYAEFVRNLDAGDYGYRGDGNPYECALLQQHDSTPDRPLNQLFGAWWIGTFCSENHWVLIDNLGVDQLLNMVVEACVNMGVAGAGAAHAAVPFIVFLSRRDPRPKPALYASAMRALEAIHDKGPRARDSGRYAEFQKRLANPYAE